MKLSSSVRKRDWNRKKIPKNEMTAQDKVLIAENIEQHVSYVLKMLLGIGEEFPGIDDDIFTALVDEGISFEKGTHNYMHS